MNHSTPGSLSITNSRSSLKLVFIKSVIPCSHLILCHPLLFLPPIPPRKRVFSSESTLRMRWPSIGVSAFNCVDHHKLWKILREMGMPDHLTCLLRNLYAGQEATVRTGHGTTDWFQIGRGVCQGCTLSPCLFNLYAEYIMRNAGLEEAQSRLLGEISITSDMQMTPPLWQKVKRN